MVPMAMGIDDLNGQAGKALYKGALVIILHSRINEQRFFLPQQQIHITAGAFNDIGVFVKLPCLKRFEPHITTPFYSTVCWSRPGCSNRRTFYNKFMLL